jgi:hypothetical protein
MVFAIGGAAVSLALTAYGSFKDDNQAGDVPGYVFIDGPIILITTAIVFGLVVPRVLRSGDPETPGRAALVLALVGLATNAVFYLGLTAVLAAAALCTALAARQRAGRWTGVAGAAVVLSVVTVTAAVLLAIFG